MVAQSTLDAPTESDRHAGRERHRRPVVDGLGQRGHRLRRLSLHGGRCRIADAAQQPVTATTYVDTTGVAGNTYYYVVKAVTGSSISPASNTASATVLGGNPPTTEVDLVGQYNLTGITADGSGFAGGLDGAAMP